jgi:drug/metabolite transporter (DMT)-like permease
MPLALYQTTQGSVTTPSLPLISVVVYLAIVVTIGGMWMWLYLIHRSGATTASTYHLANPFCGLLLSYLVLGSEFKLTDLIGILIIVYGLFIVTPSKLK